MNEIFDFLGSDFIEIYSDEDISKFDVGKVLSFDKEWLFLRTIDKFGKLDGYMLLRKDSIYKFSYNTTYIKNLCLNNIIDESEQLLRGNNLFEDFIDKNIKENNLVSITLNNGDVLLGVLTRSTENYLCIDVYMNNGFQDGSSIIFKEMISCIQFRIKECENIQENIIRNKKIINKKVTNRNGRKLSK